MELESRVDKGLGLGIIMVELVAFEGKYLLALSPYGAPLLTCSSPELTSRDHAATSTFLHIHRFFQGPSLPPLNECCPSPSSRWRAQAPSRGASKPAFWSRSSLIGLCNRPDDGRRGGTVSPLLPLVLLLLIPFLRIGNCDKWFQDLRTKASVCK
jgi:hypothetical protein